MRPGSSASRLTGPRRVSLRRKSVLPGSATEGPISRPRLSRRPFSDQAPWRRLPRPTDSSRPTLKHVGSIPRWRRRPLRPRTVRLGLRSAGPKSDALIIASRSRLTRRSRIPGHAHHRDPLVDRPCKTAQAGGLPDRAIVAPFGLGTLASAVSTFRALRSGWRNPGAVRPVHAWGAQRHRASPVRQGVGPVAGLRPPQSRSQ